MEHPEGPGQSLKGSSRIASGEQLSSKVKKTLDRLAYASLVLDVCIAIITVFTIFGATETRYLLVPINYLLTVVVVLSVVMFVVLLFLRAKERSI